MKRLLTETLLLVSALAFTINASADDRWETLRAINWVENPTNHTRMGRFGELGPYQFRAGTWRMHTRRPFTQAIQREAADEVAVAHYEWIKRNLEEAGVDATTFNIAMAWNSGVNNVIRGRAPSVSYNYAERVTNLVQSFKHRRRGEAATAVASSKPAPVPAAEAVAAPVPAIAKITDPSTLRFAVVKDTPTFEIAQQPELPMPVVYTDREPEPQPTLFVVTTAATLAPRFTLISSITD